MFLLDANVLIALGDAEHVHHDRAMRFFGDHAISSGWASCPLTENAFLRIRGHANYEGGPGSPDLARRSLLSINSAPGHQFWPDSAASKHGVFCGCSTPLISEPRNLLPCGRRAGS